MDHKDCMILETLFTEQNIKRTADCLFLTQPAVSYRIQKLEEQFGITIIVRGNKGIQFTPHGELLVERAKKIAEEIQKTFVMIEEFVDEGGTIRLGATNYFSTYHLPKLLRNFRDKYPNIKIKLITGLGKDIMQYLHNDEVHMGIENGRSHWDGEKILLKKDPLVLISKHPININELSEYPMITYKSNIQIQKMHNDWWQSHFSVQPNILIEADFIEVCKRMVLGGLGYAIVPNDCLDDGTKLWKMELTNKQGKPYYLESWLNYRETSRNLKYVNRFIEFLIDHAER